jgi:hypothetical protein
MKMIQIGKEEVPFSLFANDTFLYLKHPEFSDRKILSLRNTFSKIIVHKINIQKSVVSLLREENLGKIFQDTGLGSNFWEKT